MNNKIPEYKVIKHTEYWWNTRELKGEYQIRYSLKYKKTFMGIPFWKDFSKKIGDTTGTYSDTIYESNIETIVNRFIYSLKKDEEVVSIHIKPQ